MVRVETPRQSLPQAASAQNDEMVQAFPPNGADQAFGVRIPPRAVGCSNHFFDTQRRNAVPHLVAVDAVPVAYQKSGRVPIGKGLYNLLRCPRRGRMICYAKCRTSRRRCSSTKNTNSTFMLMVDTLKKSIETICPMWL